MPQDLETGYQSEDDLRYGPGSAESQPSSEEFDFQDSRGPLFSIYSTTVEEVDKKTTERWQKDADVILIFTGLFSTAVATLLTVTIQDLQLNSQDMSTFHLNNIQHILTDPNSSHASIPSEPPPFSPPVFAIWVNTFLFLSLLISISGALLATLLQQWARRYTGFTQQPGYSPQKRARARAFFSEGVDKYRIFWVVEALPILLHLSICLFVVGLIIWLFNINQHVFRAVIPPFYSPLSPTIWSLYTGLSYVVFKVLSSSMFCASRRFDDLRNDYRIRISEGIGKTAEKAAWQLSSEADVRILISTLDSLREDGARAKFFEAIPGFFKSEHVDRLKDNFLFKEFQVKFRSALNRFLDRSLSSNLVSQSVQSSQLVICLNAADEVLGPDGIFQILYDILGGRWQAPLQSVAIANSLRLWNHNGDGRFTYPILRIVAQVVATTRERDNHWISLTKAAFDIPDYVLRDNIDHGDSVLLALLIHLTRRAFHADFWTPFISTSFTQFDICNTLPKLRHDFCSLWNELTQEAWRGGADSTAINILRELRHAYIALHQGTDAAPTAFSADTNCYDPVLAQPISYRVCNIASHHPDWTPPEPPTNFPAVLQESTLGS